MIFNPDIKTTKQLGSAYEAEAITYLTAQGLRLLEKNYQCRMGEIDLILLDQQQLVFTEVRYRARSDFGGSIASVDLRKQRKLIRSAQHFLQSRRLGDKVSCRFDVLGINGAKPNAKPGFLWIKAAFLMQ